MKRFVGFWIQFAIDHGEIGNYTDNYLHEIREWWSPDGRNWERQKTRYEFYTGGTSDPIAYYDSIQEILQEYTDNKVMVGWLKKLKKRKNLILSYDYALTETHWGVDSGNIQRNVDFGEEIASPGDQEFLKLYKKAQHL